jgi:tungstate transport system substrate-binding protein
MIRRALSKRTAGRRTLWLGIILVLALVLGLTLLLAACGSSNAETTTTAAPSTTTAAPTTTNAPSTTAGSTPSSDTSTSAAAGGTQELILASTTSTQDSGLFDVLIPAFEQAYPQYHVKVVAVGSGEALALGQSGDADVLLVHSPAAEEQFMQDGYGVDRKPVMYNDFVIVGPTTDPAGIKGMTSAADAFKKIADSQSLFFTRNDKSGTNAKELTIWKAANITPSGSWYQATGQGMGETLTITDQKGGYTLADRATWLSKKEALTNLELLVEGDKALFNQYHVITVKDARDSQGGNDFMSWIVSPEVQQNVIGTFGTEKFGQPLFVPNADSAS